MLDAGGPAFAVKFAQLSVLACEALGVFLVLRPKTFPSIADGKRRGGRVHAGEGCSAHFRIWLQSRLVTGEACAAPPNGDIPLPRPRPAIAGPRSGKVAARTASPPALAATPMVLAPEISATTSIPASGVLLRHGDAGTFQKRHGLSIPLTAPASPLRSRDPVRRSRQQPHPRPRRLISPRSNKPSSWRKRADPTTRAVSRAEFTIRSRASSLNG